MAEFLTGQLVGFLLGLAASFLSWWVLVHLIVPQVGFAEVITKINYDSLSGNRAYRIKFGNIGRRNLVDGYVIATLSIKGLRFEKTWTSFRIPMSYSGETTITLPILKSKKNRLFRICLELCQELKDSPVIPEKIRDRVRSGKITLEELFTLGDSYLIVFVVGADALSGARKVFESKRYVTSDIHEGFFKGLTAGTSVPLT